MSENERRDGLNWELAERLLSAARDKWHVDVAELARLWWRFHDGERSEGLYREIMGLDEGVAR